MGRKTEKIRGGYTLLVKISVNRAITHRILRLKKTVKGDPQKLRVKTLASLKEIFNP